MDGDSMLQRPSTTTSCVGHPLGKNEFWWHRIQHQEKFYLPKDCFEYHDGTGFKIQRRQLQWWAGSNFSLTNYSSNFLSVSGSRQNVNCGFLFNQSYIIMFAGRSLHTQIWDAYPFNGVALNSIFLGCIYPGSPPPKNVEQLIHRVWSCCETLQDEYVTFLARPGSRLATLVLQEMWDHMYVGTYCHCIEEKGFGSVRSGGKPKCWLYPPFWGL